MLTHTATRASTEVHGLRLGLRWLKRIALALLALVVLAFTAALVFIHTDRGRELERHEAEAQLNSLFAGGGTIGKVEGTPFGELVLRDIVINGPDHKPAITIGTLRVSIHLIDLVHKDVSLGELIVEDLDVELERDANGQLEIAHLMKPSTKPDSEPAKPKQAGSSWAIDMPAIELRRAHVMIDSGTPQAGVVDLDDLGAEVGVHLAKSGSKAAQVKLTATWRQRKAAIEIDASVRDDAEQTLAPTVDVKLGGVALTVRDFELVKQDGHAPRFGGTVTLAASRADVAALMPTVELPDDVALTITASRDGVVAVKGTLGMTPITTRLVADLDAKHVTGVLSTGDFDVATLTAGKIVATGGAAVDFDVAQGKPGELPIAHATVHAHGTYQTIPRTDLVIALDSQGQHATATVDVIGGVKAKLAAEVTRAGTSITLDRASLVASTRDPAKATGGKAPVHGSFDVALAAHGVLTPSPSLAVTGTVKGKQLRMQKLSIASVDVEVDATELPKQPRGKASVRLYDVVNGDMQLGALAVDAASRKDGWVDVNITSHPKQNPWLVELGARIKPPGTGDTTEIDIERHRIRAGNGIDWTGHTGRIVIGPEQITVKDLKSASTEGAVAIDASYDNAGTHKGDLKANVDATGVALQALRKGYTGVIGVHVAVARTSGRLAGTAAVDATGVTFKPQSAVLTLHAKVDAKPSHLGVTANVDGGELGGAKLELQLGAPENLTDVAAWKARGRSAITLAKIELDKVDLAKVAHAVSSDAKVSGTIDGSLAVMPTSIEGALHLRKLQAPALEGTGGVDADFGLAQTGHNEITPQLAVIVKELGRGDASAAIDVPEHLFDPAAWKQLGMKALRSASVKVDNLAFDPGVLQRFGVTSSLRGRASLDIDVGAGLSSVHTTVALKELRGTPLAKPVNVQLDADIDSKSARATVAMTTPQAVSMLDFKAHIPISIDKLRADPKAVKDLPLEASITIPKTSAPQLMSAFGRSEIVAGDLEGTIAIAGTIAKPTVKAHLEANGLQVPPGPGGKPIKEVKQLAIDGSWDGHVGKLTVNGVEARGGKLSIVAEGTPADLKAATAKITATSFDLVPVLAFAPGPAGGAAGTLDGQLTVKGFDPRTAQIAGELHIKDARVPIAPEVGTLRDAKIDVKIEQHDIKLAAAGKLGGGTLNLDGSVALDHASLTGGQAKLVLKHVSPIGSIQPKVDADITAKLARTNTQWTADVVIDHGFIKVDTKTGEKLKPVGKPKDLAFGTPPKPKAKPAAPAGTKPKSAAFVAKVTLKPTPVESDQVRTTLKGTLNVVADGEGVDVKGSIVALGGDVDLFDRRYRIEEAAVRFDGTTDPVVAVRISHDFTDVTTITEVRGRASKPELVLSADPGNYTQSQLLGFLLGGEPGGDTQSSSAADKAAQAGESFLANQIGGYVKSSIPGVKLDVLKYEAASSTSSAAVEAGSWITHTLFFQFTERLEAMPDENDEEGTLEYWITHRLELQLTAGDRNYDGLDLLWRKRY